jgi:peptidoglycan hydrolase CwlO-like protein
VGNLESAWHYGGISKDSFLRLTAVISRHLADKYVKPDDTLSTKLSNLEKQLEKYAKTLAMVEAHQKENDKVVSTTDKTIKGMQTKLDRIDQRLSKQNGNHNGKSQREPKGN